MSALDQEVGAAQSRPQPRYHIPKPADLFIRHRNEVATKDLVIPIELVCNTPDEILIENVTENSKRQLPWLGATEPHNLKAILVGGGPSLEDELGELVFLKAQDPTAVIFALNGAANYLVRRGIVPNWQVIVDARERTAELVCNKTINGYLFGSQVHPSTINFAEPYVGGIAEIRLAHINFYEEHEDFLKLLPSDRVNSEEFVLLGSHGSVGNVALSAAYAMGFRDLHVFGYDSSFRENKGHAYSQPMNAEEPVVDAEYNGKKYTMTFTMRSQANVFPRLAYELEGLGCRFTLYGDGFVQDRWNGERSKPLEKREQDKYAEMYQHPEYKKFIPGIEKVKDAIKSLDMNVGDRVIDLGAGTGRSCMEFLENGISAIAVDITDAGLEFPALHFVKRPLWDLPMHLQADWGFCTDVMEHMPTDKVSLVIANIAKACKRGVYFMIDSVPDEMGILIGQPLHLTVKPPEWWKAKLDQCFSNVEMREGGIFVCHHRHD